MKARDPLLCLLAAAALTLAFPPYRWGFLAYWGLIPLLLLLQGKSPRETIRWSALFGLLLTALAILVSGRMDPFSDMTTLAAHVLFHVLFALLLLPLRRGWPRGYLFAVPFLWVAMEAGKSLLQADFQAFALGYTQNYYLQMILYTPAIGVYAVSFWVASLNVLLLGMWLRRHEPRWLAGLSTLLLLAFALPFALSRFITPNTRQLEEPKIEVRLLRKTKSSVSSLATLAIKPESDTILAAVALV
ncbi:MAG: hypothetical protein ONB48_11280 [candidate division KSB1 bacterium]|nr:hypothetical protein [candidate division KSB1 bacterium]MDZ7275463.1 hypothetical protein [candidate division KSB1 bacterium]MDZ7286225.1 hypothetical protein [candidate division KSB1 bacterium]MDZ7296451.1 hypothetical protein [candidate division KSB1 bacterium]MDZ7307247.1 hypothetical protein [candidate division KSB1 bacterium]